MLNKYFQTQKKWLLQERNQSLSKENALTIEEDKDQIFIVILRLIL